MTKPNRKLPFDPEQFAAIIEAAWLRAAGVSWRGVGAKLKRNPDTPRSWPRYYPELWQAALCEANEASASETAAQGHVVLRRLCRSEDKLVRDEARRMQREIEARGGTRGQTEIEPTKSSKSLKDAQPADPFEEISDEDLPQEIERLISLYRAVQKADADDREVHGTAGAA
jgi:hypothetical protein